MKTILDRMRLERRITWVILLVLMAVAFVYMLFFSSGGGEVTYMVGPADLPLQGTEE